MSLTETVIQIVTFGNDATVICGGQASTLAVHKAAEGIVEKIRTLHRTFNSSNQFEKKEEKKGAIMSTSNAETQWLAQVAAMKAAIAELNLPAHSINGDSAVDDQDDDEFDLSSSSGGAHDVWDFISDAELEELGLDSGDLMDGTDGLDQEAPYGPQWFVTKCFEVAAHRDGLPGETLQQQILDVLKANQGEEELQSLLTDLVGFEDLDFVIELISHRLEITTALEQLERDNFEEQQPTGRLLTKAEREENLRRQDFRHKNAALASASLKEPQYPHVYRTFAAGNSLNHAGKRYALPVGSERLQFEKYEEYSIPAGKPGTLWPGQKLVNIKDMDGLCRNTFKGYKTLNRMQSLVYPVAYKSSENMLICAPTGAVS